MLKYKSETGRFTKAPRVLPLPGMAGYGMGKASEQKHAPECVTLYYYQLLSLAKSFLHKSGNIGQAIEESPHRNGAISIWKDTELGINAPQLPISAAAPHLQPVGIMLRALPFPS